MKASREMMYSDILGYRSEHHTQSGGADHHPGHIDFLHSLGDV